MTKEPKRRAPWQWLSRLSLGALIVWALVRGARDIPVGAALQNVSWQVLAGSVALYWLGQILSAWRWQLLLNAIGNPQSAPVDLGSCVRWYGVGMFWNLWMPTGIGGDAARVIQAGETVQSRLIAAASVLMDRVSGMVGLLLIGALALVFDGASRGAQSAQAWRLILIFSALLIVALIAFAALNRILNKRNSRRQIIWPIGQNRRHCAFVTKRAKSLRSAATARGCVAGARAFAAGATHSNRHQFVAGARCRFATQRAVGFVARAGSRGFFAHSLRNRRLGRARRSGVGALRRELAQRFGAGVVALVASDGVAFELVRRAMGIWCQFETDEIKVARTYKTHFDVTIANTSQARKCRIAYLVQVLRNLLYYKKESFFRNYCCAITRRVILYSKVHQLQRCINFKGASTSKVHQLQRCINFKDASTSKMHQLQMFKNSSGKLWESPLLLMSFLMFSLGLAIAWFQTSSKLKPPQLEGWDWSKHSHTLLVSFPPEDCGCAPILNWFAWVSIISLMLSLFHRNLTKS